MVRFAIVVVLGLMCRSVSGMGPEMVNQRSAHAARLSNITIDMRSDDTFVNYCKQCRGTYPDKETEQRCTQALEQHARYQKAILNVLIVTFKAVVDVLEKTRDSL